MEDITTKQLIEVRNVTIEDGKQKLQNVSFTLCLGEDVVFFGAEDSGVDFICPLLAHALEDYSGQILYKGQNIKNMDFVEVHNFRKIFGYLQRGYALISNMTVYENIALPLRYHTDLSEKAIHELVDALIVYLHLSHCMNLRPVMLTQSEMLRTAFARAIALDPDMLLIEHPLEGQCLWNAQIFLQALRNRAFAPNKTVIVATYQPLVYIDIATRFIMLHEGSIVFDGTKEEFEKFDNEYVKQFVNVLPYGPMTLR
ncbi:MAG: ATP-binding cassette domain-containing protein [Spirochaetes bacterium]|nr:ATP-binding cassette domain-containing protein [Spirochaetota bacterium]